MRSDIAPSYPPSCVANIGGDVQTEHNYILSTKLMMLFCVLGLMFCFAHIIFQVVITQTFVAGMNSAASALSSVWSLTCLSILQNANR